MQANSTRVQERSAPRFAIANPANGLYWSKREGRCVNERYNYTTYTTTAKAEQAIRRNEALRGRGLTVVPDPAQTRGSRL